MRRRCLGMTLKEWSKTRLVVAWLATMAAALFAAGVWVVGQAQYINDYCTSDRVAQPTPADPEALGGRPAYLDEPVTVVCEYDGYSTATVTDPAPLLGALVLMVLVVAVAVATLRWARRERDTQAPGNARALSS
jgi:hypothetical protein